LIVGNIPVVAASLNIPLPTLKQWRYSKWWDEICQELRTEKTLQLSNKLKTIAEKALDITLDRLENGDWIYDQKTGELRRKPVVMRDAMQVANSYLDKHIKLDEKPAQEKAQQQVQDRLLALAEAFTKMANKTKKIEVIDVEPKCLS
jgi:methionyl-tRNA formyltransferase